MLRAQPKIVEEGRDAGGGAQTAKRGPAAVPDPAECGGATAPSSRMKCDS